jgi:hypothetical protein
MLLLDREISLEPVALSSYLNTKERVKAVMEKYRVINRKFKLITL